LKPFKKPSMITIRFCEKGYDDEFVKDPIYYRPVAKPPFYSFKCYVYFCATPGDIKINERTEALDNGENVIPAFHAVGNAAGGIVWGQL
jgi:hypothetical protein